jgi:hypothetical protein
MKQMTVRDIDDSLRQALEEEARSRNLSLNQCVLHLLRIVTGLRAGKRRRFHDLDSLSGTWSQAELEEFTAAISAQRQIDQELWR